MAYITERSPGVWAVTVRRPPLPRHSFTVGTPTAPASRHDAEAAARKFDRETVLRPLDPNCTLGDWLRHIVANAHDLAPGTIVTRRKHLDYWIDPQPIPGRWSIGAIRLRALTATDGGAFIGWLQDGCGCARPNICRHAGGYRPPHKARTVREAVILVRSGLALAVSRGMLTSNPWEHVKLPRANRRPPAVPGADDLARLRDWPDARVRLLLVLAADTGARRSELLALRWEQVDLKAGTLTIGASLDHPPGSPFPVLKEPKTESGRRTIALPDVALAELRAARLAAPATRRIAAWPVFANADGSWWNPMAATQAARRALRDLGLPGSLHTLRHAHATQLLGSEGRVSAHVVARRLGHADVQTTLALYAHVIPADDASAADAINRMRARQRGATGAGEA